MRLLISLLLALPLGAQHFQVSGDAPGWDSVLRSLSLLPATRALPQVIVIADPAKWNAASVQARAEDGTLFVLQGHSPVAEALGIHLEGRSISIRQIRDVASPDLPVVWQNESKVPSAQLDAVWQVRARERWSGEAVLAIRKLGKGALLWTATPIGESGYERYPFLPQALLAAGLEPVARGRGLWAFFDAGYRQRADIPYLVKQWKQAGIGAIHVTSWQFDGAGAERAEWLARLIAHCHANLIHVYAWVELPHVSEKFWMDNPQCRERTASGMEASLDWRRLMNLVNPDCAAKAAHSVMSLLRSYDWDGVNLGELYFESLEGYANPSRMTPFNADVRAEYAARHGHDPLEDLKGPGLRDLLEFRAELAARLQSEWLGRLAALREDKPNFDIVLTHIDDRFDTRMREALGADAARLLAATEAGAPTFLIEDPATVWHLGPKRYRDIRKRYEGLTQTPQRLAIDLNIVDRYQDVYPTKRQTGAELAQLIHEAANAFDQVALYFEYSLRPADQPLLRPAAAALTRWEREGEKLQVTLRNSAEICWQGPARVNGVLWPLTNEGWLLLPAGVSTIERAADAPNFKVLETNVRLLAVRSVNEIYELDYRSLAGGAMLLQGDVEVLDARPVLKLPNGLLQVNLPRGQGKVRLTSARPLAVPPEPSNLGQPLLHR